MRLYNRKENEMDRNEEYLINRFGKKQTFKVPEGYFDDFANQLMSQLPEQHTARYVKMNPFRRNKNRIVAVVAASVAVALFGMGIYFDNSNKVSGQSEAHIQQISPSSASAFDAMADYTMIDNEDMYGALSDQ